LNGRRTVESPGLWGFCTRRPLNNSVACRRASEVDDDGSSGAGASSGYKQKQASKASRSDGGECARQQAAGQMKPRKPKKTNKNLKAGAEAPKAFDARSM
jgi:hypothetical protein